MGTKTTFLLKKQHNTLLYLSFSRNSLKWILGIFQDGASLVTHSQILSTFQDGGRVKFPTPGIVVDVKIPTHVRCMKSNSPGLPDPPILGHTNDRCIRIASHPSESRAIFNFFLQLSTACMWSRYRTTLLNYSVLQHWFLAEIPFWF